MYDLEVRDNWVIHVLPEEWLVVKRVEGDSIRSSQVSTKLSLEILELSRHISQLKEI